MSAHRSALFAIGLAVAGWSPGCDHPGSARGPGLELPDRFSGSGAAPLAGRWWTAFDDPELDRLVDQALRSNLDLATAWQRLREAQAIVERESASLFPDLDASLEVEARTPEGDSDGLFLGLTAGYELDLWGRLDSRVAAERYRARASVADYQTAALTLSAEVARTWLRSIEARRQLELLERQVAASEKVLRLLENRFGAGQVRGVDIVRQRQQVESIRALVPIAEATLQVAGHQLAVLVGRPPRPPVAATREHLPRLPPLPDTGVPGELIRRRPDVQRAWYLLEAADRDLAAAISDRYPRLSLSASLATAGSASDLFAGWFASIAASLLAPLFDGGQRAAEVDRARSVARQRLYEYGQTSLVALREVEDALVEERAQLERLASLERQTRLARVAYEQLEIEFFNGMSNYIDVLTALTAEQELRRELLAARRALLERRIGLYRALAGGFETWRETR